ncbi:MAG: Gfo/Idh/MocA family protein [Limisphaerales bacterium]
MRKHFKSASRRKFLATTGTAVASFMIAPRFVISGSGQTPPSEKLNIACIGVGGRGHDDLRGVSSQNIVALCDVDEKRLGKAAQEFPQASTHRDFRKMLDAVDKSIDAVVVGTPDHTHAVAAIAAIKRGKHVYCEKPLAHSIHEVRALMKAARDHNVVTQLGNQGHSFDSIRTFCEWIWDGAIGKVHTIHAGTDARNSWLDQLPRLSETHEVPASLDWDLWLGPAQFRPYHPLYEPGRWRGWTPFGSGSIGDWICHVVDPVFWALDLGAPATIQAEARNYDPKKDALTYPAGAIVTFEFPANAKRGPVKLIWYDGTEKIPRTPDLEADDKPPGTGAIVIGDKGSIVYGSHGAGGVRIIPEARFAAYTKPARTLPRVRDHYVDWLQAIKKGAKAGSDFSYGGPLTELAMLGIIGMKLLGQKLEWDSPGLRFTNSPAATELINPPSFRTGWSL